MQKLPDSFRHIHLELAREEGHPDGDRSHGYDILAPLTDDGHIDADTFRAQHDKCRVRRFRPDEDDAVGVLKRNRRGDWYFDYDPADDSDDETGFRFGEERFVPGEYVSIKEDDGEMHTFQVMQVERLD